MENKKDHSHSHENSHASHVSHEHNHNHANHDYEHSHNSHEHSHANHDGEHSHNEHEGHSHEHDSCCCNDSDCECESQGTLTSVMQWRYATKKFDSSQKISDEYLDELLGAVHLSPTSFGLFTWKALVVNDPHVRSQLRKAAWDQSQITDASHLVVFLAKKSLTQKDVKDHIKLVSKVRNVPPESLKGFEDLLLGYLKNNSPASIAEWTKKQAYIALGTLLTSAALMEIDSCPMEGFDALAVDKILDLDSKEWTTAVMCPIGYRSEDDDYSKLAKVRLPFEEVIQKL